MTKELKRAIDMLDDNIGCLQSTPPLTDSQYHWAKTAMLEYAEQEAIAFALWLKGNIETLWTYIGDDKWEALRPSKTPIQQEIITSDQLYELYLQSKSSTL